MCKSTAAIILLLPSPLALGAEISLQPGTTLRPVTVAEGRRVLTARDDFIRALSPFDRSSRMKTDKEVSEKEFLAFVSKQVLPWEDPEREKLRVIAASIGKKIVGLKLPLPKAIKVVKTSGKEEGQAAYCRGKAIVLPQNLVDQPIPELERTVIHEIFHLLSRNNPELQKALYAIIGFRPCGEIEFPAELRARKITNPAALSNSYCIKVTVKGKTVSVVPVLFAGVDKYDVERGGEFFDYLTFMLLVVERREKKWRPKYVDNRPWLLRAGETPSYFEKIGRNTRYIIHAEEILADNFVLLVNQKTKVPTPRILAAMRRLLAK